MSSDLLCPNDHVLLPLKAGEPMWRHAVVISDAVDEVQHWILKPNRTLVLMDFSAATLKDVKLWNGEKLPNLDGVTVYRDVESGRGRFTQDEINDAIDQAARGEEGHLRRKSSGHLSLDVVTDGVKGCRPGVRLRGKTLVALPPSELEAAVAECLGPVHLDQAKLSLSARGKISRAVNLHRTRVQAGTKSDADAYLWEQVKDYIKPGGDGKGDGSKKVVRPGSLDGEAAPDISGSGRRRHRSCSFLSVHHSRFGSLREGRRGRHCFPFGGGQED